MLFLTAFTWGLGVSCGGAFGLIIFIVLKECLYQISFFGDAEHVEASIEALIERNRLSEEANAKFERMAQTMESCEWVVEGSEVGDG